MAIAYRSASAVAVGTTSLSIAMPTGTVANDIMVAVICCHATTDNSTWASGGWEKITSTQGTNGYAYFAWKRAGGSEAGPYSVTNLSDSCCGAIMSFSGCRRLGNPISVYTSRANASGVRGTLGVTTTEDNCMVINATGVMDNLALSAWVATSPATFTERFDGRTTNGSDTGVGASTALKSTAGATGATSYTIASAFENVGLCCALVPLIDTSIPAVDSTDHAHTATVVDTFDIELTLTDNCSHAHTADNVGPDVMLEVQNSAHAHDATVPTIVHNVLVSVYTHLFCWLIAVPAVGGIPGPKIPHGCNASELSSYVTASGKTVTFNIEERTDQDSAGTNIVSSDQVADDNGTTTGTFANKYLAKDNYLWIDISAVDADALQLSITLACTDETDLVLANSNHGHYTDEAALTQAQTLVVQNSDHAHDVDNLSLDPVLILDDCSHSNIATVPTLVEDQVVTEGSIPGFWTWVVDNPGVGGIPGPKTPSQSTVTSIQSYTTTDISVAFNVEERTTIGTPGTNVMTADQTAIITGALNTTPDNPVIDGDSYLWLDISSASASTGYLMVTVTYLVSAIQALDDCVHGHTCDNVALDVDLVVDDSTHAHTAGNVDMSASESGFGYDVKGFYTWTLSNPQVGVVPGPKVFGGLNITEVSSYVTLGTSATFNVESRGDFSLAGVDVLAADQVADVTGEYETVPDFYVPKDRWLCLDVSAVSWLDQEVPPLTASLLTVTVAWEYNSGGIDNCVHGHVCDNVVLVADEDVLLTVASTSHANTSDTPTLSQYLRTTVPMELIVTPVVLVVADCTHAHTTDATVLTGNNVIYFPSSGTPSVSPANNAYWDEVVDADRIIATRVKGTTALANKESTTQNSVATSVLSRQYVLGDGKGLMAHSYNTTESFKCVVRCSESDAAADSILWLTIQVFDLAGTTSYGTIYSGAVNNTEMATSLTSRFCSGRALTGTINAPDEHILVFEFGSYATNVTGDEYTITMDFGDLPATALSLNNIDTGDDYPYLEYDFMLTEYSVPLVVADCTHAHTAEEVLFEVGLAVDNCDHAHDCDNVVLQGISTTLVVANCTHAHDGGTVDFPISGTGRRIWVKEKGHWVQITPGT